MNEFIITSSLTIDGDLDNDGTPDITISADSSLGADDADSRVFLVIVPPTMPSSHWMGW